MVSFPRSAPTFFIGLEHVLSYRINAYHQALDGLEPIIRVDDIVYVNNGRGAKRRSPRSFCAPRFRPYRILRESQLSPLVNFHSFLFFRAVLLRSIRTDRIPIEG